MTRVLKRGVEAVVLSAMVAAVGAGCQSDLRAERNRLAKQNKAYQQKLKEARKARQEAEAARSRLTERVAKLEKKLKSSEGGSSEGGSSGDQSSGGSGLEDIEDVAVESDANTVTITAQGDILFPSGSASLRSSAKETLDKVAKVLQSKYSGNKIRVEGHTDSVPIGQSDWTDNLELSSHRALAVERHLMSKGISGKRMESVALGAAEPVASNDTASGREKNRRVEIVVIKSGRP